MSRLQNQQGSSPCGSWTDQPWRQRAGLPSVKREYRVGPAAYFVSVLGFTRAAAIRATSYRCPHCGHLLRADFCSGNITLGLGVRCCAECGEWDDDGPGEWPQLTVGQKMHFCCPPILAGIAGGMALTALAALFFPYPDWRVTAAGLVFAFVPMFFFILIRQPRVLLSIHRYNRPSSRWP